MALVKGMGACLIAKDTGLPCGGQIQEGEAIGTVISPGGPLIGHKKCADDFHARKAAAEREKRSSVVQKMTQNGPGGPVDPRTATDMLASGSVPLEKVPGRPLEKPENPISAPGNIEGAVAFIGDLPEEASPDEAVAFVGGGTSWGNQPTMTLSPTFADDLTAEEADELERHRQHLLANRRAAFAGIHAIAVDLSNIPEGATVLQLNLDLSSLRGS
jgi:hypothetical protein